MKFIRPRTLFVLIFTVLAILFVPSGVVFGHCSSNDTTLNPYRTQYTNPYYSCWSDDGYDYHWTDSSDYTVTYKGVLEGWARADYLSKPSIRAQSRTESSRILFRLGVRTRLYATDSSDVFYLARDTGPLYRYATERSFYSPVVSTRWIYGRRYYALGSHNWVVADGAPEIRVPDTRVDRFPLF